MSKSSGVFEPLKLVPIEPFALGDEPLLTDKDKAIIDCYLTLGNEPRHVSGIERDATIRDRSGRIIQGVTKKHASDRCRHMEKMGLLKHVVRKPIRGSLLRTPHYYLSNDIEAFQILVEVYLSRENVLRKIIFMQSEYLDEAIEKNIEKLLVRWLIPDEEDEFLDGLTSLIIERRIQRAQPDSDKNIEVTTKERGKGTSQEEKGDQERAVQKVLDALKSIPPEDIEGDLLSIFDEMGVFTKEQKTVYGNIARLSPTALHLLVFLPLPRLVQQYQELGLVDLLGPSYSESRRKEKQELGWRLTNRIVDNMLFHSMVADLMRYPFLMMRTDKRELLQEVIGKGKSRRQPYR
ncbi:MAG: hypothetical protein ACW99U_20460 [Candidatus Thorarchaeota archaeon]|jgi:hypothetical protein